MGASKREDRIWPEMSGLKPSEHPGPRPSFAWVPVEMIVADDRFQRDAGNRKGLNLIKRIVEEFSWRKFQPPTVAPVEGGKFTVIDGQHRTAAARLHPGIDEVPCYIVDAPDLAQQAEGFVAINRDRVKVNPMQIHHAGLAAGDKAALAVQAVCDRAGVSIPRYPQPNDQMKPAQTCAIGYLKRAVASYGGDIVVEALSCLMEASAAEVGGELTAAQIQGVCEILAYIGPSNIDRDRLVTVLADRSADDRSDAAHAYCKVYGGSLRAAVRTSIVRDYNKGQRVAARLAEDFQKGPRPKAVSDQRKPS